MTIIRKSWYLKCCTDNSRLVRQDLWQYWDKC